MFAYVSRNSPTILAREEIKPICFQDLKKASISHQSMENFTENFEKVGSFKSNQTLPNSFYSVEQPLSPCLQDVKHCTVYKYENV